MTTGRTRPAAAALAIAVRDTRARIRDRSAMITAFVAPLVLATILSFALGGSDSFSTTLGVHVADDGPVGAAFLDLATGPALADFADVVVLDSPAAVDGAVAADDVNAAWIVPSGLSERVTAGGEANIEVVTAASSPTSAGVAEAIAAGFAAEVDARGRAVRLTGDPSVAQQSLPAAPVVLSVADPEEVRDVSASYFGPAMATFFVFFIAGLGPRSLLRERREQTLPRLLAAPISPASVLAGKAIGVVGLGIASMLVMWGASTVLLGADWGAPTGVILLIVGFVLAAAAITTFVATLTTTEQQADGAISVVVFLFALLGGSFIRIDQLPDGLSAVAVLTPNGAAINGFVKLIAGEPTSAVTVEVAALLGATILFVLAALPRLRKVVEP